LDAEPKCHSGGGSPGGGRERDTYADRWLPIPWSTLVPLGEEDTALPSARAHSQRPRLLAVRPASGHDGDPERHHFHRGSAPEIQGYRYRRGFPDGHDAGGGGGHGGSTSGAEQVGEAGPTASLVHNHRRRQQKQKAAPGNGAAGNHAAAPGGPNPNGTQSLYELGPEGGAVPDTATETNLATEDHPSKPAGWRR